MNNRILAMLLALVAAMFISIAPVKAEAASAHTHYDNGGQQCVCDEPGCTEEVHNIVNCVCTKCAKEFHEKYNVPAVKAGCTTKGNKAYQACENCTLKWDAETGAQTTTGALELSATGHNALKKQYRTDETHHTLLCDVCGNAANNKATHTFANYVSKGAQGHEATCTTCGYTATFEHTTNNDCVCDNCDYADVHNLVFVEAVAATCTTDGNVAYYDCTRAGCNDCFKDAEGLVELDTIVDPATGHDFDEIKWGEGTQDQHWTLCNNEGCNQMGSIGTHKWIAKDLGDGKHGWVCKECEYVSKDTQVHQYTNAGDNVVKNETAHIYTCTVEGCGNVLTEEHYDDNKDCVCDRCGYVLAVEYTAWQYNDKVNSNKHFKVCVNDPNCSTHHQYVWEEHKYVATKSTDGVYHTLTCSECNKSTVAKCSDKLGNDCLCDTCGGSMKHDASMMDTQNEVAATCTENGQIKHYKCRNCNGLFDLECKPTTAEAVEVKKLGHEGDGYWRCNKDGHYQTCKRYAQCQTKVTDATGKTTGVAAHTYDKWLFDNAKDSNNHYRLCTICAHADSEVKEAHKYVASPSENGTTHKLTCNDCGKVTWQNCSDKDGNCVCDVAGCGVLRKHVITESTMRTVKAQAAGCLTEGWEEHFRCEKCENLFNRAGEKIEKPVIEPLDHKLAEKDVSNTDAYHLYQCVNPGCSESVIVPHNDKTGDCLCDEEGCDVLIHEHKTMFVPEVAPTCTEAGTAAYYKYVACGRMFACDDDGTMGAEITAAATIPATGHDDSGEWEPADDGKHVLKCVDCDEILDTKDHDYTTGNVTCDVCGAQENLIEVEFVAPDCENDGNVHYWESPVTHKKYADANGSVQIQDVVIPALGHEMSGWQDAKDGKSHKQVCMNGCGYTETEKHTETNGLCFCVDCNGGMNNHKLTLKPMKAATCTANGTEAYFQCSCGQKYDLSGNKIKAPAVIEKTGHDLSGKVQQSSEGKHYIQCEDCTFKQYEEHVLAVEDPMEGNYHQWICECGELEIEQHYDNDGDKKCDVCKHDMSNTAVSVQQHNNVTVKTGEASKIDSTKTWFQNWWSNLTTGNAGGTTSSSKTATGKTTTESAAAPAAEETPASNGAAAQEQPAASNSAPAANNAPAASGSVASGNTASANTAASDSTVNNGVIVEFFQWLSQLFNSWFSGK